MLHKLTQHIVNKYFDVFCRQNFRVVFGPLKMYTYKTNGFIKLFNTGCDNFVNYYVRATKY